MRMSYSGLCINSARSNEAVGFRLIRSLLYIAIALYPVLPVNYYIGSFSYANVCAALIIPLYVASEYGKLPPIRMLRENKAFWIFEIYMLNATVITVDVLHGITALVSSVLVPMVIADLARNENNRRRMLDGVVKVAVGLAVLAFYEALSGRYLIQSELLSEVDGARYGILRATGPFGNPILLGLYQAIAALICFYRLVIDNRKAPFALGICAYITIVASILFTVSRLALCLFFVGQIILILRKGAFFSLVYLYVTFALILIGVAVLTVLGFNLRDLVEDFFASLASLLGARVQAVSDETVGFGNRLDLYAWVANDIGNNWLLGLGVGAPFAHVLNEWTIKTSIEVHYLYIYYQCGLAGLLLLVANCLCTLRYIASSLGSSRDDVERSQLFLLLLILGLYYICLFGVQETDLARLSCELVALAIGISVSVKNSLESKAPSSSFRNDNSVMAEGSAVNLGTIKDGSMNSSKGIPYGL